MTNNFIYQVALLGALSFSTAIFAQENTSAKEQPKKEVSSADAKAKADQEIEKKASDWVASLNLNDAAKESRVKEVIATHLKTIRDWNNEHPFTTVPAGIDPATGQKLTDLDRQVIANSAMPASVHENLMSGLRKDLSEEQVELVLDKYTIGKVQFTLAGYKSIVPNMTKEEEDVVLKNLKQAREQAVDYKNMKQISAIFEIYKTKCEQYFNNNGRNWRQMFKTYVDSVKAQKAAAKAAEKK